MNLGMLNSTVTSTGPSVGASSLVTDANSALCSGPKMHKSTSINDEAYMRLPLSPMSFTSNTVAGSPVMEVSSVVQHSPHQEGLNKRGSSAATSEIMACEASNSFNVPKRIRSDTRQGDILEQQVNQQHLLRRETMQPSGQQNLQLQAMSQHQRLTQLAQQQKLLQSLNQSPRAPLWLQQQQSVQLGVPVKHPLVSGICSRRLKQCLYHQRQRPLDNNISYWKHFVNEYFAPQAKKRFCLSMYNNTSNQAPGTTRQSSKESWDCNLCGSKSGKGFVVSVEILPTLYQIIFEGGNDENMFLDVPRETRLASGLYVLEYAKAVQESVYQQLRVVREGQLRIMYTQELKILSWEFCIRRHEEFLPKRVLSSEVNQLFQVSQKFQSTRDNNGVSDLSHQNLQATCNNFITAGRHLAKSLDSHFLNVFGFPKKYDRCLQVYEVVNSMKPLIDISQDKKLGPIESLKNYSSLASVNFQMPQESGQLMSQILPVNSPTMNMGIYQGSSKQMNCNLTTTGVSGSNQQNVFPLSNHQNATLCPNQNDLQRESSNINGPKQAVPPQNNSSAASIPTNRNAYCLSQQQRRPPLNGFPAQHNKVQLSVNQYMQQTAIQQHTVNNNMGIQQYRNDAPNISGALAARDTSGVGTGDATVSRMASQSANNGTLVARDTSGIGTSDATVSRMASQSANNGTLMARDTNAASVSRMASQSENNGTLAARDTSRIGTSDATVQLENNATNVHNTSASLHNYTAENIPSGIIISGSAITNPGICGNSLDSSLDCPMDLDVPSLESLAQEFCEDGWFNVDDSWFDDNA